MPIQQMFMGLGGVAPVPSPTWTATGGNAVYGSVVIEGVTYKIHKFTSPGNFVITPGSGSYDVIVIGGGGSGGVDNGGAGGAGGIVDATVPSAIVSNGTYGVTIGAGGAKRPGPSDHGTGSQGSDSTMVVSPTITLTAKGGGAGNGWTTGNPGDGGSGAGQSGNPSSSGTPAGGMATQPAQNPGLPWVTNLGNSGGAWSPGPQGYAGGGGGGGQNGQASNAPTNLAGYGGLGYLTNGKYGPSGQGLNEYPSGRIAGGGTGGWDAYGGASGPPVVNTSPYPHNGVLKKTGQENEPACANNTGSGGHGGNHNNVDSGAGGSGIVVIRYVA